MHFRLSVIPDLSPAEIARCDQLVPLCDGETPFDTAKVREIGQAIFDQFAKEEGSGASGLTAMDRIRQAIHKGTEFGPFSEIAIHKAWQGVGDGTWQYRGHARLYDVY